MQTVVEPGAPVRSEEFTGWVRPHLLAMTRLATRMAPAGDGEDIVQEALVRAWRRRSTFDASRGSAQAWLLAIVADRARRARTRRKPAAEQLSADRADPATIAAPDPSLDLAIRRLPRQQRLAVELFYFVGLPVHECAAVLGVAEGTVSRLCSMPGRGSGLSWRFTMPDLEDRLTDAGERFRTTVASTSVVWSRPRPRRRMLVFPAAAVLVAAGLVAAVVIHLRGDGGVARLQAPAASGSPDASAVTTPAGGSLAVAVPGFRDIGYAGPLHLPACAADDVTASAVLSGAHDGVLGLIRLRTVMNCAISIDPKSIELLDSGRHRLNVPVAAGNPTDPYVTPGQAEWAGDFEMGFAWTGSYCGSSPTGMEISWPTGLHSLPAILRIVLSGAPPRCAVPADSRIILGVVGGLPSPTGVGGAYGVEPAPVAWSALSARLELASSVPVGELTYTVVLTNHGGTAVDLSSPCPDYQIGVGAQSAQVDFGSNKIGTLCGTVTSVPAHQSIALKLSASVTDQPPAVEPEPAGTRLTLVWAMAGVPSATATAVVR